METTHTAGKAYRPLLPVGGKPIEPEQDPPSSSGPRKRTLVAAACENCRKRKAKCSGERPKCRSCIGRNEPCTYNLDRGKTRYYALATKHQTLEKSDTDLRELLGALQNRSDREASDILQRLRSETDPLTVLNHVRDGELLLQPSRDSVNHVGQDQSALPFQVGYECSSCGAYGQDCTWNGSAAGSRRIAPHASLNENSMRDIPQGPNHELALPPTNASQQSSSAPGQYGMQSQALKRKHTDMERLYHDYNSLYSRINTGTEGEATAIFRSLRNGEDPSKVLRMLQNRDMQTARLVNSRTTLQQAILHSLIQSTASLQNIIEYFESSGRSASAHLPPVHGIFEPLKNRTIDLSMLQQALQRRYKRPLEGLDKAAEPLNLDPNISANDSRDKQQAPPVSVPAWPWTRLTTDDVFVSKLISLFLSYCNSYLRCVEEKSFLKAMRSGQLKSEYCSPFLVNAICAYAAMFSDDREAFMRPGEPLSRGEHFHLEALRLWQIEEGRASLVNLQAVIVLMIEASMRGKDRLGVHLLLIADRMNTELSFTSRHSNWVEEEQVHYRRARETIAWTVYFSDLTNSNALLRLAAPLDPRLDYSRIDMHPPNVIEWSGYPFRSRPTTYPCHTLFEQHRRLHRLSSKFNEFLFSETSESRNLEQSLSNLAQKFVKWREELPESLQKLDDHAFPVFELHADYLGSLMGLYNSPKVRSLRQEIATSNTNETDYGLTSADGHSPLQDSNNPDTETARNWIKRGAISSAHQAATLLQLYRRTYGLKIVTPHLTQIMAISAFILLEDLPSPVRAAPSSFQSDDADSSPTDPQPTWNSESAFEEIFRCLLGASMQAMLPRGIARMVYRTAQQLHIQLPARVNRMMEIAAGLVWQPKDLLRLSSQYPNVAIMDGTGKRGGEVRMEELLKRWEKLDLNDEGEDQQTVHA